MTAPRRGPLTAEQQALASDPRYLALASRIAGHFAGDFPRLADEFHSEAGLALCQASRSFELARRVSFYSHAENRIQGAMIDVLRDSGLSGYRRRDAEDIPRVRSLDATLAENDIGRTYSGHDAVASDEEPVGWELEALDELKGLTRTLPARHRTVVRLLYGHAETRTMKVAARAIGTSESWVSQIHTEAIQMLRS